MYSDIEIHFTKPEILKAIYHEYLSGLPVIDIMFKVNLENDFDVSIAEVNSIIDYLNYIYV